MSDKITITTEKDGRTIVFEGSGTLTLTERAGGWVETRPTSMSRDVHGVEIEWDGDYTIREADRQPDAFAVELAPVAELRITEHALRDAQEKAARKREKLVDHIESLNAAMRRKNERIKLQNAKLAAAEARIKELRRENRRLDAEADGTISLDGLRAAWAVAEVPTDEAPIRGGDVIIYQHDGEQWSVREVEPHEHDDDDWSCSVRILSRAPKREPWADLADAFKTWGYPVRGYEEELAKWVYAKGVRVTGGDE